MNVIFRTDAEQSIIGTGHIMRCLNLAEELSKKGANIHFITRRFDGHLGNLISKKKYKISFLKKKKINGLLNKNGSLFKKHIQKNEAEKTLKVLKKEDKNLVIIDHYFLNAEYEKFLKKKSVKVFVIDDLANRKHNCDFILDQNYSKILHQKYNNLINKNCKKLFGTKYALVNQNFKFYKTKKKNKLDNLLVFMGGSDPKKEIFKAIEGINNAYTKFKFINIVIGKSFKYIKELKIKLKKMKFQYKLYVQTQKMYNILAKTDLAILSGGMITWEKCVVGVPSLVTIKSKNQINNSIELEKKGVHIITGYSNKTSPKTYTKRIDSINLNQIKQMKNRSRELCDGKGVSRVARKILNIFS